MSTKNKDKILESIVRKVEKINKKDVVYDLEPFIETQEEVVSFSENFRDALKAKVKNFARY